MNVLQYLKRTSTDILHLIYPETCLVCQSELSSFEKHLCTLCKNELHHTDFENYKEDSPLDKLFWGRIPVNTLFALLYYKKNDQSQAILHHLKYYNRPDLAQYMGELIGERIKEMSAFSTVDFLVPIPLHEKKKHIRGYNQSEEIAKGIATLTNKPINTTFLTRQTHTESQTRKGKFERWTNVQEAFCLNEELPEHIKHIALVDDVITTGSTLETAVKLIKDKYPIEISIISIAYAGG
ncbi:MAG TPA: ComF family protein [Crocinitomicaceae bacterium]|nr:ComF family protein [Crocinitomicaceae bacterium]